MAASLLAADAAAQQAPTPQEVPTRIQPLEVQINGVPSGLWPLLEREGRYYAPDEAFDTWRIKREASPLQIEYRGLRYRSVSGLPGSTTKLDDVQGLLDVTVAGEAFTSTRVERQYGYEPQEQSPAIPAFFVNYDLSADWQQTDGARRQAVGVSNEFGFSNDWGVFTTSVVGRNLLGTDPTDPRRFTRLNTSFQRDFPASQTSLLVGDGIVRSQYLGRSSYFGGIQFGSNYATTPGFVRSPIPVITGETRSPSTVQLYINNVLRQTNRVPSGPFTLDNLPTISGAGEVSVVVRDILGRETLISQPFYVTADLLAPGLDDWSVQAGRLRRSLGTVSNDYGDAFAAGGLRRGITNSLTLEGRVERTQDLTTVGGAGTMALGGRFVGRLGVTASQDALQGAGQRVTAGLDGQVGDRTFAVVTEYNSRSFLGLGDTRGTDPIRLQTSLQGGFGLGHLGRLGVGLVTQSAYGRPRVSALTLSHYVTLFNNWQLRLGYARATGDANGGDNFNVALTIPLDNRTAVASTLQVKGHTTEATTTVASNPATRYGTGWRLRAQHQDTLRTEGGLYHFGPTGVLTGEASVERGQQALRFGASGGVLAAGGKVAATPRMDTSAALVEVPGFANVGVETGGQTAAVTDSRGRAIVTGLPAYVRTPIQLAANDLPVTAEIDNIEASIVPRLRSVTRIVFPVRGGRGAMVAIVLDDGQPAPVGAAVRLAGDPREALVSRKGEAYVTGLGDTGTLELLWKGQACKFQFQLPAGRPEDLARIGPLACHSVRR